MGYDMMWIHDYMATLYRSSQRKRTGFQGARKGEIEGGRERGRERVGSGLLYIIVQGYWFCMPNVLILSVLLVSVSVSISVSISVSDPILCFENCCFTFSFLFFSSATFPLGVLFFHALFV